MTRALTRVVRAVLVAAMLVGTLSSLPAPAGAALTDDSPSARITRLYQAYFLRVPEPDGLAFWVNELDQGRSLASVAEAFAAVPEFSDTYGPLDNVGFVTLVYNNVLERDPENGPSNFWVGELDAGRRTRGEVMIGFSESQEFRDLLLARFDDSAVFRLYCAYFDRQPDSGGRQYWKTQYANDMPLASISQTFAGAPEFQSTYGSLNNAQFVDLVYLNVLDRARTANETFWLDELNAGRRDRGTVMIGFSESAEYKARFSGETCPINTPPADGEPVAVDDMASTIVNIATTIDWRANDTIVDNATIESFDATSAQGGSVATGADDEFIYTPATNFVGADSFGYTLCDDDPTPNCDSATVTVDVQPQPPDGDPVAVDDSSKTGRNHSETVVWGDNDMIVDNATLSAFDTTTTQLGTVSEASGVFTYTPAADFVGTDTFTYTLCDDDAPTPTCDSATVTIEVLTEPDCTVFINYPKDGTDLGLVELFLKSTDCYQEYEIEYGFAHTSDNLVWSNITIDGQAASHGDGTRGILSEDVTVDATASADGVVVVAGELALVHDGTTYMTVTFTETFTDNGTVWVNSSSNETFDHILNPFAS